ncbi:MAG: TIGR03960 family B12-binding radical SAM protein [Treponema sp.]|jgi:radical SAM family uncharacterized protein|nr:TIGR03960 family B12-binding radical SAM protein [Treponema sp.]
MPHFVDPVKELGGLLLGVEKPARYCGGEYGRLAQKDAVLRTLIAFPDLYEIGMSNQALRIIYNRLNRIPGISCDRAFAPAPDFEKLLCEKNIPLYGLDTGISLKDIDLLMFTLGYELGTGGILSMLNSSGIPLHCAERKDHDPIVIAGGPAISNPLPYSMFIDAFWIGEAEAGFFDLVEELMQLKKAGQGRAPLRAAMLQRIAAHPNMWVQGKEKTYRAIDTHFAEREGEAEVFPVPSMKIVQHHGAVEIMRGCPNGCRFCHAGFWYRPMRQKKQELLIAETEAIVKQGGWHEISLSSLSSGDYTGIGELVETLNRRFGDQHVSFQLPSLKVSSFSLGLLEKISETRKSGLTFAVETPLDFQQLAINKQVTRDSVVEILREAKKNGWRGAKFYFMIGLPLEPGPASEEAEIVNFIIEIARRTNMHFNINVGIFVPKPHTPYQWAAQINSETAAAKLAFIRSKLKPLGHKVSVSDPLISLLEGIVSRGDERAGLLIEQAFRSGSRLDAWSEYINKDAWIEIIEKNKNLISEFLGEKSPDMPLPWRGINSGVSLTYLQRELEKSGKSESTLPCAAHCAAHCGICGKNNKIIQNKAIDGNIVNSDSITVNNQRDVNLEKKEVNNTEIVNQQQQTVNNRPDPSIWRMLFTFCKEESAVFHGHLSLIELFSMAFIRASVPVMYTKGFNPLAKMEIAAPLSTGISAGAEIAAIDFANTMAAEDFMERLNRFLPEGIRIQEAETYYIRSGSKKHSLSSLLWGFGYQGEHNDVDYVQAVQEKQYRQMRLESTASVFSLKRTLVLAKNIIEKPDPAQSAAVREWASYFEAYRFLYPVSK